MTNLKPRIDPEQIPQKITCKEAWINGRVAGTAQWNWAQ